MSINETYSAPINTIDYDIYKLKQDLKNIMWDKAGIIRNEEGLSEAREKILELYHNFKRNRKCLDRSEYEYRNMLSTALLIVDFALNRKESRGAHSRSDYRCKLDICEHSIKIKTEEKELIYAK
jgi:L-aspartate oxidase